MRGQLTEELKAKSLELLGYEINQTELRLLPYLLYCLLNKLAIDYAKVNRAELDILNKWIDMEFIHLHHTGVMVSKAFYDIANELLFIGYIRQVGHELT